MAINQERLLTLALSNLMEEKSRVDAEVADLQAQLRKLKSGAPKVTSKVARRRKPPKAAKKAAKKAATVKTGKKGGRNPETASAMKKLWAKARAAGFANLKDYKASLTGGQQ